MPLTVLYSCSFVPPEWIEAHGVRAERLIPAVGTESGGLPETGVCPYARSFAHRILTAGGEVGVIFTTRCDQMRRLSDVVRLGGKPRSFLLNVPATCGTAAAERLYAAELLRLSRWLQDVGGSAADTQSLLDAATRAEPTAAGAGERGVALGVVGGPLPAACGIHEQVAAAGGRVVLDATETGECSRPAKMDPGRLSHDPVGELTRAYLAIPSVHQRPNSRLFAHLRSEIGRRGVRGLVLRRYVWCDLWHGEAGCMAERLGVPVLDLEIESDCPAEQARIATRLGAFVETLRSRERHDRDHAWQALR